MSSSSDLNINIIRPKVRGETCTVSRCEIDGQFVCYVLEDVVREVIGKPVSEWKIYSKTAIPVGMYNVLMTYSPHFERVLPLLENVPGFSGVRIHPGNNESDTEGCLLPGLLIGAGGESVERSRDAYLILVSKIKPVLDVGGTVTLTIR